VIEDNNESAFGVGNVDIVGCIDRYAAWLP
jgi:hypothetical protein